MRTDENEEGLPLTSWQQEAWYTEQSSKSTVYSHDDAVFVIGLSILICMAPDQHVHATSPLEPASRQKPSWADILLSSPFHLQLQAGISSDEDFGPSLLFLTDQSRENTLIHGISIGSQVADSLFGYEVDVVVFAGLQNYLERGFQPDSYGLTVYWKVYREWTPGWLPGKFPLRFGLGQGISYASRIPVSEQRDFEPEKSAETVHYLEWSVQLPVGRFVELAGLQSTGFLDSSWIGYTIFHRSTVFGLFADTGGGINYPGVSLELVFE